MPDPLIARVANPDGRVVALTRDGWAHIVARHPEMSGEREALLRAIEAPDLRAPDARPGRERYFLRGGPSRWILVIVDLADEEAFVVTAFAERRDPPGWQTSGS